MVLSSPAAADKKLEDHRTIYQEELSKIESDVSGIDKARELYLEEIEAVIRHAKKRGDFEGTRACLAEKARYVKDAMVPHVEKRAGLSELEVVQRRYHDRVGAFKADKKHRVISLYQKYRKALKRLLRHLLESDQMVRAESVNEEIKTVDRALKALEPAESDVAKPAALQEKEASEIAAVADKIQKLRTTTTRSIALKRRLPRPLRKGLLLYYDFNTDHGARAEDLSGNENHGTVAKAEWVLDARCTGNGAYRFTNADQYIINAIDLPKDRGTIAHWLCPAEVTRPMVAYYESNELRGPYWYYDGWGAGMPCTEVHTALDETGAVVLNYQDGRHAEHIQSSFIAQKPHAWIHAVATWNRKNEMRIYVNGEKSAEHDVSRVKFEKHPVSFRRLGRIGAPKGRGVHRHWVGLIDDVMVWDRVLSAREVKQLHSLTK